MAKLPPQSNDGARKIREDSPSWLDDWCTPNLSKLRVFTPERVAEFMSRWPCGHFWLLRQMQEALGIGHVAELDAASQRAAIKSHFAAIMNDDHPEIRMVAKEARELIDLRPPLKKGQWTVAEANDRFRLHYCQKLGVEAKTWNEEDHRQSQETFKSVGLRFFNKPSDTVDVESFDQIHGTTDEPSANSLHLARTRMTLVRELEGIGLGSATAPLEMRPPPGCSREVNANDLFRWGKEKNLFAIDVFEHHVELIEIKSTTRTAWKRWERTTQLLKRWRSFCLHPDYDLWNLEFARYNIDRAISRSGIGKITDKGGRDCIVTDVLFESSRDLESGTCIDQARATTAYLEEANRMAKSGDFRRASAAKLVRNLLQDWLVLCKDRTHDATKLASNDENVHSKQVTQDDTSDEEGLTAVLERAASTYNAVESLVDNELKLEENRTFTALDVAEFQTELLTAQQKPPVGDEAKRLVRKVNRTLDLYPDQVELVEQGTNNAVRLRLAPGKSGNGYVQLAGSNSCSFKQTKLVVRLVSIPSAEKTPNHYPSIS